MAANKPHEIVHSSPENLATTASRNPEKLPDGKQFIENIRYSFDSASFNQFITVMKDYKEQR